MPFPTARSLLRLLVLVMACGLAFVASANDTTARVAVGGIEPLKSPDVRMLRETLTISQKLVTVHYVFLNESDHDVQATIAFPMPAYGWWNGAGQIDSNNVPLTSFEVQADGRSVPTRSVRRALAHGREVTRELRALGLDDEQIFVTFGRASDVHPGAHELPPATWQRVHQVIGGSASETWEVEETRLWEQTFPAHREIVVEHRYSPFVGRIYDVPYQQGFGWVGASSDLQPSSVAGPAHSPSEACVGDDTKASIQRQMARLVERGAKNVGRMLDDVEYILGTGRNWKGPIGDFTLRIEKARPNDIVSLCFPGQPRRVSPTALEFHETNFVPQDRLVVYFYSVVNQSE